MRPNIHGLAPTKNYYYKEIEIAIHQKRKLKLKLGRVKSKRA